MARPKEYDDDEALRAAMMLFWKKGFQGTNTRELAEAMELSLSSLRNGFGSKRDLYLQVLQRYGDVQQRNLAKLLPESANMKTLREYFSEIAGYMVDGAWDKGCLINNALSGDAPYDDDVREILSGYLRRSERVFRAILERGKRSGEFRGRPKDVSHFLAVFHQGLLTVGRGTHSKESVESSVRVLLHTLS
ncbi:MAG: TetR/AcrR family transcriptional regulator [Myxococcales bacterium]|nr:TetR/AcrR family transcriptional regulator [Myxococcales bacterium]